MSDSPPKNMEDDADLQQSNAHSYEVVEEVKADEPPQKRLTEEQEQLRQQLEEEVATQTAQEERTLMMSRVKQVDKSSLPHW